MHLVLFSFLWLSSLVTGTLGLQSIKHQTFSFRNRIIQHAYFKESTTILARLEDSSIWQSSDEGYTWVQTFPQERFIAFYHHKYSSQRAYLLTNSNKFYATTDSGRTWNAYEAPTSPNTFHAQIIRFHPDFDRLIWTGNRDCDKSMSPNCRAEAQYSRDNGRHWHFVEDYVVNCAWGIEMNQGADPTGILCESYQNKTGSQRFFGGNPLALVQGSSYFTQKNQIFNQVIGFARFSDFLVVAELADYTVNLQISTDGVNFSPAKFPRNMSPSTHAYTVLESKPGSLLMHMTTSEHPNPYWGNILDFNTEDAEFEVSIENVSRDERGFVDFESMADEVALTNVVVNTAEAVVTGRKKLRTMLTRDNGQTWYSLTPPKVDANGNDYQCGESCTLNLHSIAERAGLGARIVSSSNGMIVAVGNVGASLGPYEQGDMFISRDAGHTWVETFKGAHSWAFGDSMLVMAKDEGFTDHVVFSTDAGRSWHEYRFSDEEMRVTWIVPPALESSRRFILVGHLPRSYASIAVHVDLGEPFPQRALMTSRTRSASLGETRSWSSEPPTRGTKPCHLADVPLSGQRNHCQMTGLYPPCERYGNNGDAVVICRCGCHCGQHALQFTSAG
ncbi:hypothetical protein FB45DRAFT_108160 [Roridomyces roridus]|uniref:VPS10 domain-containing protein n=1 Tax=Roridomyces roridus TaxID=1738132 RepID=A0AAD7BKF4_9AGAR|nr:hypothetical protein FB45DRAFT_108160 [Roridomyces roridus]